MLDKYEMESTEVDPRIRTFYVLNIHQTRYNSWLNTYILGHDSVFFTLLIEDSYKPEHKATPYFFSYAVGKKLFCTVEYVI
jgi:hypothetical protein